VTPDDEERDAVEDVGYDWDEDDYEDDVADSIPEDEDADSEYLDYVDRYCTEDE
jgi:hypothetical protein